MDTPAGQPKCHGRMNCLGWCLRPPTVERDGKAYCWQHDPVRLKAKADARWEQRKAELAKGEADHEARIERRTLERDSGVDKLTNDDLRRIIAAGGIQALLSRGEQP